MKIIVKTNFLAVGCYIGITSLLSVAYVKRILNDIKNGYIKE